MCRKNNSKSEGPQRLARRRCPLHASDTMLTPPPANCWRRRRRWWWQTRLLLYFGSSQSCDVATYCGWRNFFFAKPRTAAGVRGLSRPRSTLSALLVHYQAGRLGMAALKSLSLSSPPPFLLRWLLTLVINLGIASTGWRSRHFSRPRGVYEPTSQNKLKWLAFSFCPLPFTPATLATTNRASVRWRVVSLFLSLPLSLASISCDVIDRWSHSGYLAASFIRSRYDTLVLDTECLGWATADWTASRSRRLPVPGPLLSSRQRAAFDGYLDFRVLIILLGRLFRGGEILTSLDLSLSALRWWYLQSTLKL